MIFTFGEPISNFPYKNRHIYRMKKRRIKCRKSRKRAIQDNVVRKMSHLVNDITHWNRVKGVVYFNIHLYLMFAIGFIAFFTTSVNFLIVLLVIVTLDAISVVFLHECPLTLMEKKYLGITSSEMRDDFFGRAGIMYKCDHTYEKQIELLINVWIIIATKCLSVMLLQMFNVKLFDASSIYTSL